MTGLDIAFGFLAGVVSCLTPAALPLFPLTIAAARAAGRAGVIAPAVGLGLSLILTGILVSSFGLLSGFEAIWFRRIICVLLFLQGIALMSASLSERYPVLTGGRGDPFAAAGAGSPGGAFRQVMLALFIGANWWHPVLGPTLGRATLLAADIWNSGLALAVLFAFGAGAALPWIVLGRVVQFVMLPFGRGAARGMAAKRLLGLSLVAVAVLGATEWDARLANRLDPQMPSWAKKLAITF